MFADMLEWIGVDETVLWWLAAGSVVTFVASLIVVPWMIVRIPPRYFVHRKRQRTPWAGQHPVVRGMLLVAKNVLGGFFVVCGLAMLLLPGQGILTMVMGILLLDFPGKYRFERWLISRGPVLGSINWLRRRSHRAPLVVDR